MHPNDKGVLMADWTVKDELTKVLEEIREFTAYAPQSQTDMIEYLCTARSVINCYDRIIASRTEEEAFDIIHLLRSYLKDNPQYLDFHIG